jgi:hypothetical protein
VQLTACHERIALPDAKNRTTYNVIDLQNAVLCETYCSGTGPSYDNEVRCDLIRGIADLTDDVADPSEKRR